MSNLHLAPVSNIPPSKSDEIDQKYAATYLPTLRIPRPTPDTHTIPINYTQPTFTAML